jgi:hypothetical protein
MGAAGSLFAWRILPATRFANARRTTAPAADGRLSSSTTASLTAVDRLLLYDWDMTKLWHDRKTAARDGRFGNPVRR